MIKKVYLKKSKVHKVSITSLSVFVVFILEGNEIFSIGNDILAEIGGLERYLQDIC